MSNTPSNTAVPQKRSLDVAQGTNNTRQRLVKVTRACDVCKARKSKCSGDQPCESCIRRGLTCQYEAIYLRGKVVSPRPSGPAVASPQRTATAPGYTHAILSVAPSMAVGSNHMHRVGEETEPPSRASPGLEIAGQYSDSTSGLSFLNRAWRRISSKESSQVVDGWGSTEDRQPLMSAGDKPFLERGQLQMPSLDRSRQLLHLYFDVCIATYRLLHRPTVECWLGAVSENAKLNQTLFHDIGRAKTAVVLSVLAIASFHEEKASGESGTSPASQADTQSLSDMLFTEASRLTQAETGIPKLESAQCRLIQVLYLLMSCRFNQAWYTFGHALQIISALGLHRRDDRKRQPNSTKRDYIGEQCRKRTFWVAYTLDKYLGVIFGRPRHYHDEDIDQDFPDAVNDEDMTSTGPNTTNTDDCHIESLVYHARLAQIAEKISREVYSIKPVPDQVRLAASHRLGAELRQWKASLPPFLGAVNPSSLIPTFRRQATALRLSYCHAVILAHRPFLLKNARRSNVEMTSLAQDSLTECIAAARSVLEAVDRMAREGRLFHAFWWTHYVCFCALVVVYVWAIQQSTHNTASAEDPRGILDQAESCLQHLAQATASNSPSRRYSIILQELRTEAKRKTAIPHREQVLASSATANGGVPPPLDGDVIQEPDLQNWQPLFGSPMDMTTPGLQNFLDDWQTTDWLDLDASAFCPFPEVDDISAWMNNAS
ncbi:fungal-specific transcription factor domain-containing protein [Alternaria rosae]|uniref:fungal-specific transcription factor domain-containing protein n=1 Tax=Alternaria rosae TaxID=1187941 RepID=UPI001E8E7277|nr:fungal-specific transcription factor domain-containing protein [Alternaria rosae]KAH6866754.1 fungal-specific transcription factor domain-containing protein [Alternaria rosae]